MNDTRRGDMMKKGRGRGFASMSNEDQRRIASKGGKAAHQAGTAHEWNSREAAEAGRKGGKARAANSALQNDSSDLDYDAFEY